MTADFRNNVWFQFYEENHRTVSTQSFTFEEVEDVNNELNNFFDGNDGLSLFDENDGSSQLQLPPGLFDEDDGLLDATDFQDETQFLSFDTSASSTSVLAVEDLVDSSRFGDRFSDYLDRFNDVFSFENASNLDQAKIGEIKDFLFGDFFTDTDIQISDDLIGGGISNGQFLVVMDSDFSTTGTGTIINIESEEGSGGNISLDSEVIDIINSGSDSMTITDFGSEEMNRLDFITFSDG